MGHNGGMQLRTVPLSDVTVAGALDLDHTDQGVVVRRLPAWTRHQLTDLLLATMVTMPAGVRLEFETDSPELEIDVMLTLLQMVGRPLRPAAFDLTVDGTVTSSVESDVGTRILYDAVTRAIEFQPGEPTTLRFRPVASGGMARVEVWLPHASIVALKELRVAEGSEIRPMAAARPTWVHYGSSISHCMESPTPTGTWPAIAARRSGVALHNLAFAGQCMLDQVVARTIRDTPADYISIKAGINVVNGDTMRERTYVPALHGFLDTVRDGHPRTPIALVTPIICPAAEDHPGPTVPGSDDRYGVVTRPPELWEGALTLRRIRALSSEVVEARRRYGDLNLHLMDGLSLFGESDTADLYDGLHPNAEGYRRMGARFAQLAFSAGGPFADRSG